MKILTKFVNPLVKYHQNGLLDQKHIYSLILVNYKSKNSSDSLTRSSSKQEVNTNVKSIGEKVKETTKTASYLGVILLGVGVTGTLFYAVFRELFSKNSPNNIYSAATKKCLNDYRITDKLGTPVVAYGEETRRGRRQHPAYGGFIDRRGRKHLQMKFYLKGTAHKATVYLEMIENDSGDYEYNYLKVEIDDFSRTLIVLEDGQKKQITDDSLSEFIKF